MRQEEAEKIQTVIEDRVYFSMGKEREKKTVYTDINIIGSLCFAIEQTHLFVTKFNAIS